jgi:hypothetical protein
MPFSPERRLWYLRAWGDGNILHARCQTPFYSEVKGFHLGCEKRGSGLFVARWTVSEWGTVGIPFCRHHFMELTGRTPHLENAGIYPELAEAFLNYPQDPASFNKLIPYSTSHRTRIGDSGLDVYIFLRAKSVIDRYNTIHPEDRPPPDTRGHHYPSWVEWTDLADTL